MACVGINFRVSTSHGAWSVIAPSCPPRGHRNDCRAAPLSPLSRPRPLPRRPRLPLLRRHRLPGPARRDGPSFRTARVVSPRVAGGAGGQVRRDRPPVWSGRGVGGRAGHVRVCPRLVGGAPVGRGGSRCVAARPSPSGQRSILAVSPAEVQVRGGRPPGEGARGEDGRARTSSGSAGRHTEKAWGTADQVAGPRLGGRGSGTQQSAGAEARARARARAGRA